MFQKSVSKSYQMALWYNRATQIYENNNLTVLRIRVFMVAEITLLLTHFCFDFGFVFPSFSFFLDKSVTVLTKQSGFRQASKNVKLSQLLIV